MIRTLIEVDPQFPPEPAEPQDGSVIAFGNYHVFSREDENASEEGNWFETGNSRGYKWNNFPYSAQKNGLADYVVLRDGFPEGD